ncbi:MAG TPA: ABC transporter ATP-binding protein [Acidimicrobiales bacterium]
MSDFAVDVRNVSKRFRLAHGQYNTAKERIIHGGRRKATEDFWALSEVSLTVKEGQTVGILGRNGSGKSTLLKCICGVLQPTSGEVAVRGKLAGLLELGAGFQQDLTGRENIYLNGSLLGMTKSEVDRNFDAIVDFSELEEFIDGPVKFYSSGMAVRLGFAVAVNVDPDILVIDEVLAVGDERFQRKCIDRVKQFQKEGRTILLVTHAADTVRSICDAGVVLSHGRLVAEGDPGEATRIFRERLMAEGAGMSVIDPALVAVPATPAMLGNEGLGVADAAGDAHRPVRFRSVHRVYSGDNNQPYMSTGDDLTIRVEFEALQTTEDVVFSLEIRDESNGNVMRTDTSIIGLHLDAPRGIGVMHFGIVNMPMLDGSFTFALGIQSRNGILYDWQENAGKFEVMNPGRMTGSVRMDVHAALISTESSVDSAALA